MTDLDRQKHIDEILNVIQQFANGHFSSRAPSYNKEDSLDAIATGINMLGEEVDFRITELKQAEGALKQLNKDQTILLEVSNSLTASLEMKTVLQNIINMATHLVNLDTGAIYIINGDELYLGASSPPIPANFPEVFRRTTIAEHPHIQKALSTGKPHILPDMEIADLSSAEQAIKESRNMRSLIYVPLKIKKKVLGVLILGTVKEIRSFTKREIDLYITLSNQSALAIENARLFEETTQNVKELEQHLLERKVAEEDLRESEERYRNIIDSSPMGMHMYSFENGRFVFTGANPSADILLGVENSQFIGKTIEEAFPPLTETEVPEKYKLAAVDGTSWSTEQIIYDDNVISGAFEVHAFQTSPGKMVAMFRDITRRKQAEDDIRKSEFKYRTLTENLNVGVYRSTAGKDGKIIELNKALISMFGYSNKDDLKNLHASDLYQNPDDRAAFTKKMLEKGQVINEELNFYKKDGTPFIGSVSSAVVRDDNGRIIFFDGIVEDITKRKQVEDDRVRALQEARDANKVKDLFLANMSHEIRTPLNSILGFSEIIEEMFKDRIDEEEREYFQIIQNGGKRLIHTVHDILDISQIEAGTVPYNPQVIRLASAAELIFKEFEPVAAAKELKFNFDNQISDGTVDIDEHSTVKALSNLVDNAIKYTVEGMVSLKLNEQNGKYVITISDSGIGISPDYLENMYDTFSQESTGYTKNYQGLGLGLSIAKSCLDMNEIPIEVESKQGKGTTFRLTFTPADNLIGESDIKAIIADTQTVKSTSKIKPVVLLVEDDKSNRKALEVILKGKYETPYAVSVTEAKKQLREYKVDLIILDLSLEGDEDGLDLVAYMKAKKGLRDI
ncbi:MAG: PAS domain S-box protein, partial [Candidatus Marinimicrobia bacterium]|nr:PAS domain S-box protein [Candidatus Neomarinimicrobiota bacterium]